MNLVVYGSLINKNELLKEGISLVDVECVRVQGFKRVFNQEPSYRFVDSINRAVLNVQESKELWFNAIVIKNLSEEYFKTLDEREKGYNRVSLKAEQVISYDKKNIPNCFIYIGKKEKESFEILPNEEYLNICLKGVKTFGEDFHKEFLDTTYKNSKNGLILIKRCIKNDSK